jgi:uncharacterized LabA/DUF88 family protein
VANRVAFIVDGFNLYHSVRDIHDATGHNYRWLDIHALCNSYLSAIGGGATLEAIYYFSALAYYRERWKPGTVGRHKAYLRALESTGIDVELSRFKAKDVDYKCGKCGYRGIVVRHEEKETDVAVAAKLIELAVGPSADAIAVLSGDTDLVPAVRTARRLAVKPIYMLFPAGRSNSAFAQIATGTFTLSEAHYQRHQFPDPVLVPGGATVCKPPQWT